MKVENFCPLCGKTEGRFIKGFCKECFLKKHKPVEIPEQFEFEQCKSCSKVKFFGKMQPATKESLAALLKKSIKAKGLEKVTVSVSLGQGPSDTFVATVFVKGIIDNVPLSFEKDVLLHPKFFQCDACMKLSSQYHEAIIQLRVKGKDKKKLKQVLPKLIRLVEAQRAANSLAAVTETTETKAGFDLKVGSKKAAQTATKQMQHLFNAETKQSSKVLGRDKVGREKHRFTFLVRV